MRHLAAHVESLLPWIERAREVVVVDSESSDGTPEFLERNLRHPRLRIEQHPPGLYASWNAAIAQVTSPYTYISTVGDALDPGGVAHLVEAAEGLAADVVISAPRFVAADGRGVPAAWPVHLLNERSRRTAPWLLPGDVAEALAAAAMPRALLGSAASNLYRTDVLKARPFGTEFGAGGDVVWGLRHAGDVRWCVTPKVVSQFLLHDGSASQAPSDPGIALRILEIALAKPSALAAADPVLFELERDLYARQLEWYGARASWQEARQYGRNWWLRPSAWRVRARRKAAKVASREARRPLLERVLAALPPAPSLAD